MSAAAMSTAAMNVVVLARQYGSRALVCCVKAGVKVAGRFIEKEWSFA